MARKEAPFERFQRSYVVDQITGCWNWLNFTEGDNYGAIKVFGNTVSAHRFSYELYHGPVPDGLEVLHSCDNKQCVNPEHLSAGTHQQNMTEAAERGRMRSGAKHPFHGKPSPLRGIGSSQAQPVMVLGRPFGSIKRAECEFGLGAGSVRYWLATGNPKARVISREEYRQLLLRTA